MFTYMPEFLDVPLDHMVSLIDWDPRRRLFGNEVPRNECWYSTTGKAYRFSGEARPAKELPSEILELVHTVSATCGVEFDSVLCNLYRSGRDSVTWHSDDEPDLGDNPVIASLSLGASRVFKARRLDRTEQKSWTLKHGDLLIMHAGAQESWEHCVPKTKKTVGPRVNLTFRKSM